MRIFVLDNYDSFTFNLAQHLGELGACLDVRRNDEVTIEEIAASSPDAVVISPGPGRPGGAGISIPLVHWCADSGTPLLGVCLGHQAIGAAFGGRVIEAPSIMHGKTSMVHHDADGVLRDLAQPFEAMRYHSLVLERSSLPPELVVSAWSDDDSDRDSDHDVVMGVRHTALAIEGVQFHPESILTNVGKKLLGNFVATSRPAIRRR